MESDESLSLGFTQVYTRFICTGAGKIVVPRLPECCRQVEAEEVSNSRN